MTSPSNTFQNPQEDIGDLTMTLSLSPEMNLISAQGNKRRKVIQWDNSHTQIKQNNPSSTSFQMFSHSNTLPPQHKKNHSTCFTPTHTKDIEKDEPEEEEEIPFEGHKGSNNQYDKLIKQKTKNIQFLYGSATDPNKTLHQTLKRS